MIMDFFFFLHARVHVGRIQSLFLFSKKNPDPLGIKWDAPNVLSISETKLPYENVETKRLIQLDPTC